MMTGSGMTGPRLADARKAGARRSRSHSRPLRRGAMLLEVLLSLGLLIFGMAVVGMQIRSGLQMAERSDLRTRAVMLMETKFAEMEAGVLMPESYDDEMTGGFGVKYPGFAWRMLVEPTDVDDLYQVQMQIWFSERTRKEQLEDPELEVDYEEAGMRQVMAMYRLFAKPADVDLERDFGIPQDVLDELAVQVPIPGFDPNNIDPRALSSLDPEILEELLPMLEQIFGQGADINSINDLSRDQREQLRDAIGGRGGRDGREGRGGRRGGRDGEGGDPVEGRRGDGREGGLRGRGDDRPDRGGQRTGRRDEENAPRAGDRGDERRGADPEDAREDDDRAPRRRGR